MRNFSSYWIVAFLLLGLNTSRAQDYNVKIEIRHSVPYCGGAAPSYEDLNQSYLVSGNFYLVNLITNQKTLITSNSKGIIALDLNIGKYGILEAFKNVSFHEFKKNNESNNGDYYQTGNDDCYKKWWKANLIEFEVTDNTKTQELKAATYSRCFTGNNPCDMYNGPYPP